MGLIGRRSISEGKNRGIGLAQILGCDASIYCANTNIPWPGKASVVVHHIHIIKKDWQGIRKLNNTSVTEISSDLTSNPFWELQKLNDNLGRAFQGTILLSEGFKIDADAANSILKSDKKYEDVLM